MSCAAVRVFAAPFSSSPRPQVSSTTHNSAVTSTSKTPSCSPRQREVHRRPVLRLGRLQLLCGERGRRREMQVNREMPHRGADDASHSVKRPPQDIRAMPSRGLGCSNARGVARGRGAPTARLQHKQTACRLLLRGSVADLAEQPKRGRRRGSRRPVLGDGDRV